jgi:hypothetical protein
MARGNKIASVTAGVVLIAGIGMAAAPASATLNKRESATVISFKKDFVSALRSQGIKISAQAPATWNSARAEIRFPVTGVTADSISHSGGMTFTKGDSPLTVTNPAVVADPDSPNFTVFVESALGRIPLLVIKNTRSSTICKVDGAHHSWIKKTTTRVHGFVHLTADASVVATLQGLLTPDLTADLGLGAGRVTLVDDLNSKTKLKC